jgi:tetratricopeptide (TPR) repeat protein
MEEKSIISKWIFISYTAIIGLLLLVGLTEGILQYFKKPNQSESSELFNSGEEKAHSGKYKEAITDYDKAILLDTKNAEYYCKRGIANYELKYFSKALKDFNISIVLNPNDFTPIYTRALLKKDLKDYKSAIADYTRLITLFPNESDFYRERAFIKNIINDF